MDSVFRSALRFPATADRLRLQHSTKDSLDFLQRLKHYASLKVHSGCVNSVVWSECGRFLLSGSDDQRLVVSDPFSETVVHSQATVHRANIFSARFLPFSGNRQVVSCSGDGLVSYTNLEDSGSGVDNLNYFNCHSNGTTYEVLTVPNEASTFMSCGEDCTVRLYDLRKTTKCHKTNCRDNVLIASPLPISAMDVSPRSCFYLAVGCSDGFVRIYDRRNLALADPDETFTRPVAVYSIPPVEKRPYRITSVAYNPINEQELLVSYSSDQLYLFDLTAPTMDLNACWSEKNKRSATKENSPSPPPVRRLRLRGDWTDTGPESRPSWDTSNPDQPRPQLQATIMHRMTEVLSRMLSDPRARASLEQVNDVTNANDLADAVQNFQQNVEQSTSAATTTTAAIASSSSILSQGFASTFSSSAASSSRTTASQAIPVSTAVASPLLPPPDPDPQPEEPPPPPQSSYPENASYKHIRMTFTGHRNARTMIKEACFYGDRYVMSGSDCGHVFAWEKSSGRLVQLLPGDKHVVNCIQPHPAMSLLATSGIDYDIKLWAPVAEESCFDEVKAREWRDRNAVMLQETRDTITVPASFMILLLSSLSRSRTLPPRYQNFIRSLRARRRRRERENAEAQQNQAEGGGVDEEVEDEEETSEEVNENETSQDD